MKIISYCAIAAFSDNSDTSRSQFVLVDQNFCVKVVHVDTHSAYWTTLMDLYLAAEVFVVRENANA